MERSSYDRTALAWGSSQTQRERRRQGEGEDPPRGESRRPAPRSPAPRTPQPCSAHALPPAAANEEQPAAEGSRLIREPPLPPVLGRLGRCCWHILELHTFSRVLRGGLSPQSVPQEVPGCRRRWEIQTAVECLHLLSLDGQWLAWDCGAFPPSCLSPKLSTLIGGKWAWKPLVPVRAKSNLSQWKARQTAGSCVPTSRCSCENHALLFLRLLPVGPAHLFCSYCSGQEPTKEEASAGSGLRCQERVCSGSSSKNETGQGREARPEQLSVETKTPAHGSRQQPAGWKGRRDPSCEPGCGLPEAGNWGPERGCDNSGQWPSRVSWAPVHTAVWF